MPHLDQYEADGIAEQPEDIDAEAGPYTYE
jgi:hypothetical protein